MSEENAETTLVLSSELLRRTVTLLTTEWRRAHKHIRAVPALIVRGCACSAGMSRGLRNHCSLSEIKLDNLEPVFGPVPFKEKEKGKA